MAEPERVAWQEKRVIILTPSHPTMKKLFLSVLVLAFTGTGLFLYLKETPTPEPSLTPEENLATLDEHSCNTEQMFTPPTDEGDLTAITLYVATSEDGVTFGEGEVFLEGGGVPSVTTGPDGTLVAVFNWFTDHDENPECYNKVALKTSSDNGKNWEGPYGIYVEDMPSDYQLPFDPTITTTEDGKYRLFFTTHVLGMEEPFVYGSALSEDGLHYTWEGVAFSSDDHDIVDSSEVRVGSTWTMIAPMAKQNGEALQASSTDGKTFVEVESERTDDMYWVGNMVNVDGTIRFYGACGIPTRLISLCYSESDDAIHWSEPVQVNIDPADPGIAYTKDGTFVIIYSEQNDMPMPEDQGSMKR